MAFPVVNPPPAFDPYNLKRYNLESARARARTYYRETIYIERDTIYKKRKTIYKGKGGRGEENIQSRRDIQTKMKRRNSL